MKPDIRNFLNKDSHEMSFLRHTFIICYKIKIFTVGALLSTSVQREQHLGALRKSAFLTLSMELEGNINDVYPTTLVCCAHRAHGGRMNALTD